MPFFPLAGAELVALILVFAVGRWILRTWWRGELEDEVLARWLPRRRPPRPQGPPELRLIRGGRDAGPGAQTDVPPGGPPRRHGDPSRRV